MGKNVRGEEIFFRMGGKSIGHKGIAGPGHTGDLNARRFKGCHVGCVGFGGGTAAVSNQNPRSTARQQGLGGGFGTGKFSLAKQSGFFQIDIKHAAPRLQHLSFKVKSRHIEHTLTRANIIRDQSWAKVMREAVKAANALREALLHRVEAAVEAAAEHAGVALPAAALWAGLAGAGNDRARRAVEGALPTALSARTVVGTDVEAAFYDAFRGGPGVLLIAGTGSVAWARGTNDAVCRVGGWGRHLGDEGSGYALGSEGLRSIAHSEDGRGPATALRLGALEALGGRFDLAARAGDGFARLADDDRREFGLPFA